MISIGVKTITSRVKTGWWDENRYYVVKPLHNGFRQELIMFATREANRWYITAGVFSCNATYLSVQLSSTWHVPTSTNKKPSITTVSLALEALKEIENVIKELNKEKRKFIYIDGMDERRLRVYTKLLTRGEYGYKKSSIKSEYSNLHLLYKRL